MNYIGRIIKEHRIMNNMSRETLAEDICTEKYIYLVEKGERTPSANIIKLFGDRLGVDFFSYYKYLDCENPIAVKKYVEEFNALRAKFEPQLLYKSTIEAMKFSDFNSKPWLYEIKLNNFFDSIYIKNEYKETILEINKCLEEIELKYSKESAVANLYIALSICYGFLGNLVNAKNAAIAAHEIMCNYYKIIDYEVTITNIQITIMTMSYLLGENDTVISKAEEILKYKNKIDSADRIHYPLFYLAFSQYKIGLQTEAIKNFKKGLYFCLGENKEEDVKLISMQDVFLELINNENMNKEIVNEFKLKYNITYST